MLADASAMAECSSAFGAIAPAAQAARPRAPAVIARDITDADVPDLARLLHEGFPSKPAARFLAALRLLGQRDPVPGVPRYGCLLAAGQEIVGVLLTIAAEIEDQAVRATRCNVSCWYVRPAFRLYAPLLVLRSYRNSHVTHFNISPAHHTLPTITAQGFAAVSSGTFVGLPLLAARGRHARIHAVQPGGKLPVALPDQEARILQDHAAYGCVSLICEKAGAFWPFVFRRRHFRRAPLPGAQLIYCRSLADLGRLAGAVGGHLARHGMPWLLAGANARIDGIPGIFMRDKMPIYFKGPRKPREGDLAYTEAAMFGF